MSNAGILAFGKSQFSVNEDGTTVVAVTINRTGGSDGIVSTTINFSNVTATAGSDYNNNPITVSFADGETSKTVNLIQVNQGLYFDGVNNYVNVGPKSSLEVFNAVTMEAWIKPTGNGVTSMGGTFVGKEGEYLISSHYNGTINQGIFILQN